MNDDQWDAARQDHDDERRYDARQRERARAWQELEAEGWFVSGVGDYAALLDPQGVQRRTFDTREEAIDYALQLAAGKTENDNG